MSYRNVMVIKAVVCLVFGILLLFAPVALFRILGLELSPGDAFPAREYAAALFGNLMIAWFARNAVDSDARRAIILGYFVYDAIGVVISVIAVLSGTLNPLGWGVAVVYLFFTWGFGNLLRRKVAVA
jgi:hypothetical protein